MLSGFYNVFDFLVFFSFFLFISQLVANVADCDEIDTKKAIDVANNAFQLWKSTSCRDRSALLKELHANMLSSQKDLATIMAIESGTFYYIVMGFPEVFCTPHVEDVFFSKLKPLGYPSQFRLPLGYSPD